jgi:hypothetical protein
MEYKGTFLKERNLEDYCGNLDGNGSQLLCGTNNIDRLCGRMYKRKSHTIGRIFGNKWT